MTHTQTQGADGAGTSLDDRLRAAGMFTVPEMMGETPLTRWQTHAAMTSLDAFEWWLDAQVRQYLTMKAQYEIGDKPKDDELYEWVLAHSGAFHVIRTNFRAAKAATPAPAATPGVPDSVRALSEAFAETACCASCTTPMDCYQGKPCRLEPVGSGSGVVDHEFKSHPDVFWPAARGEKTFEYRRDDRGGYEVGQTVRLRCYDLTRGYHDTAPLDRRVTNILRGGEFELPMGYCILSLAPLAAQPAGQSEPPILRVVVEVYPDRTDTRLTFGDRIRPEPGVKAVEQAISALQAEFDGRNGCPAIKSSKRSPQETWISVSALQPQQKAMLGRWSQGAPNEDGSPHFYWQQCSGRYFDFQGERHWCLDGHRFEGAPFYGESPTHALIIAEPPPHGSWGNQVGQSEDDVERCIACDKPLKAGELVLPDAEGGTIHTACCGPERESYTGADGGPLGPNDPIPQGYVYEGEQPARQEGHDRKWVCNGDPAQPAGQAGDAGAGDDQRADELAAKAPDQAR